MDVRTVIKAATEAFVKRKQQDFDRERVENALLNELEKTAEEYDAEDIYAMVTEFLYCYLLDDDSELKDIDGEKLDEIIKDYFSRPIEWHIERDECFKWYPDAMDDVWFYSGELFDMAKDAYFDERSDEQTEKAKEMFEKIIAAGEILKEEEYVYRSKEEIFEMYAEEVSESQLDLDVIIEESPFLSFRLARYIRSLEDEAPRIPDIPVGEPFKVPDDLFEDLLYEEEVEK